MKAQPYVGITGPTTTEEVEFCVKEFQAAGYTMSSPHVPMLGFLVSYKTLSGEPGNRRYPKFADLPGLLERAKSDTFPMIHYNSREHETLADQVSRVFDPNYDLCKFIQLNVVWPNVQEVQLMKRRFPKLQVILQLSARAMEFRSYEEILDKVARYEDNIAYVLIDPSGGAGLEFQLGHSLFLNHKLRERFPYLTIGFAGGLSGENVRNKVTEITKRTLDQDFCIDAESGVRDKITLAYGDDILNVQKVRHYLQEAGKIIR